MKRSSTIGARDHVARTSTVGTAGTRAWFAVDSPEGVRAGGGSVEGEGPALARCERVGAQLPPTLLYSPALTAYRFRPGHPLNPRRLELTMSLIEALGLAGTEAFPIVEPRAATEEELALVHDPSYIAAVRELSSPGADPARGARWGLGTEDTPIVPDMHEASLRVVGATLAAAELVMEGTATRAFTPAGGLHHALPDRASGFCVYNDLAVAIRWLRERHGARVLYLDYDAHHGDGVQAVFYRDPGVLTVSFHESGVYLFPATGFVEELGEGDGYGYAVNVPLEAHTEDDSFEAAYAALVPELAAAFRPDVIVLQNGCDAHALDPLAHLRVTTGLFERLVRLTCAVADEHCGGRIVATGGGGYAAHSVVPRAWTLAWAALSGQEAPDQVPETWRAMVREEDDVDTPPLLRDPPDAFPAYLRRAEVEAANDRTVRAVRGRVLPLLTGWGMGF